MTPGVHPARRLGPALLAALAAACADSAPTAGGGASTATTPEAPSAAHAPLGRTIYGLDDRNTLVVFDGDRPGQVLRRVPITGASFVKGIDFRPNDLNLADGDQTGFLYAVTMGGAIYTVDPVTGAATLRSQI